MPVARSLTALAAIAIAVYWTPIAVAQTQPRVRPGQGQLNPQSQVPRGTIQNARQANAAGNVPTGPPKEFVLTSAQEMQVDRLLKFWERKTSGVKTLAGEFGRWVYDPVFGPKGDAATFTTGVFRYASPDKGMIQEKALDSNGSGIYVFDAELKKQGAKWPYKQKNDAIGEHWVCDGKSVFEFNHKSKQLVETRLPAEMQGQAIAEGPLPFMFGAKADTIKKRYWVREIPKRSTESPFQLEFIPKGRGADFARLRVDLDAETFLPTGMVMHDLNSVGRSTYAFKNLKANDTASKLQNFLGSFVSPKTPRGWEKIVHNVATGVTPRQAQGAVKPKR